MINIVEAKNILEKNTIILCEEEIDVTNSLSRILSNHILSPIDVPSFDNSAMDGYAFQFQKGKNTYQVVTKIQAGDFPTFILKENETARIFTGAPIPKGADTVIPQESVQVENEKIFFEENHIQIGNHIRFCGAQCKKGDIIVQSGTPITPGVIGLLSSVGIVKVKVFRQPLVKVIITGNEIVEPGTILKQGEIYNSNQSAIGSYLQLLGIKNVEIFHVKDNLEELKKNVSSALKSCDVLILSGGISVGEYDFVYNALSENGVEALFYKIKQKPGKPLFVGKKENQIIFALPGNPAAVLSCMNQYVKPCLLQMMGAKEAFESNLKLPLAHDWKKKTPLANILKAEIKNGKVTILEGQDSFNLQAFAVANAFVVLYEQDMFKQKGEFVEIYKW